MRHIPSRDTRTYEDVSFEAALKRAIKPNDSYDVEKWLFVPCAYEEYRYILGTRGKHPLICIGINPSTAAPDRLDPTLKSAQRIALSNGYDSFMMMNVCAQRATSPGDMDVRADERLHAENLRAFDYLLSLRPRPAVWAAWGNLVETRPYLLAFAKDMIRLGNERGAAWYCCGPVSRKGHPHHPLYLKANEPLVPFGAEAYLQKA